MCKSLEAYIRWNIRLNEAGIQNKQMQSTHPPTCRWDNQKTQTPTLNHPLGKTANPSIFVSYWISYHYSWNNCVLCVCQDPNYEETAQNAWDKVWDIIHTVEGWKLMSGISPEDGCVYSRSFPEYGKIFKLEASARYYHLNYSQGLVNLGKMLQKRAHKKLI